MGALDLAAHRRKYPKAVMDAVVSFLYPLAWQHITTPYPFPHELYEDLAEGGSSCMRSLATSTIRTAGHMPK